MVLCISGFAVSCASIIHGTRQDVSFLSTPTGAKVTVDHKPIGETPLIIELKRKDKHLVKIELDGFEPYEMNLTRKYDFWILGNIVFGGLIGIVIDLYNGGVYKISPDEVHADLVELSEGLAGDAIYFAVVLEADPSWEKIGTLKRKGSFPGN